MRVLFALGIPIAAALLQASLVPQLQVAGVRPSLPLLVAASWSIAAGAREGTWWAFIGGIAADLLSGGPLGAFALASLPAVAAIGLRERSMRPVSVPAAAVLVGVAALVSALLYVAILALAGQALPPLIRLVTDSIGSSLFTAALALGCYPLAKAFRGATEQRSLV